jgi:hypothetical protein
MKKVFLNTAYLPGTVVSILDSTQAGGLVHLEKILGGAYIGQQRIKKISADKKVELQSRGLLAAIEREELLAQTAERNRVENLDGVGKQHYQILTNNALITVEAIADYGTPALVQLGISRHFAERIVRDARNVITEKNNLVTHEILQGVAFHANDTQKFLTIRIETADANTRFWWSDPNKKCNWVEPKEIKKIIPEELLQKGRKALAVEQSENGEVVQKESRVYYHKVNLREIAQGDHQGLLAPQFPSNRIRFIRVSGSKYIIGDISVVIQETHAFVNTQIIYSGEMFNDGSNVVFPKQEALFGKTFCDFWRTAQNFFDMSTIQNIEKYKPQAEPDYVKMLNGARLCNVGKLWANVRSLSQPAKAGKIIVRSAEVKEAEEKAKHAEKAQYAVVSWYVQAEQSGGAYITLPNGTTELCQIVWNNLELPSDGGLGTLDSGDIITFESIATPNGKKTRFTKTLLGIQKTGFNSKRAFVDKKNKQKETAKVSK